jgi:hypothetical protein
MEGALLFGNFDVFKTNLVKNVHCTLQFGMVHDRKIFLFFYFKKAGLKSTFLTHIAFILIVRQIEVQKLMKTHHSGRQFHFTFHFTW